MARKIDNNDSDEDDDGSKGNGTGSSLARAWHWRWQQCSGGIDSGSIVVAAWRQWKRQRVKQLKDALG
jgi:hypothetical protein